MKGKSAITLVALIITIIVLLILATVSISLVINNGVLDKAQHGVDKYSEEEELEQIKLAVASAMLKGNGFLDTENLNSELRDKFGAEAKSIDEYWKFSGYKIERNGKVARILPKEFQEVEYIQSTGTQYIDTGVIPCNTTGIYIKHSICNDNSNDNILIGVRENYGETRFWIDMDWTNTDTIIWGFNEYSVNSKRFSIAGMAGKIVETTLNFKNDRKGKVNGIEIDDFDNRGVLTNQSYSITLFCANFQHNPSYFARCKAYNLQISEKNEITHEYIPCYSKTAVTDVDGVECPVGTVGMYDIVESKFYTNKGTGTFGYETEDGIYVAP